MARAATNEVPRALYPSGRQPTEDTCVAAWLNGVIAPGDAARFGRLLAASAPFLGTLYLNVSGGDDDEAMRIGETVRRWRLVTGAPFRRPHGGEAELLAVTGDTVFELCTSDAGACGCTGACGLVWVAGARRDGNVLGALPAGEAATTYAHRMEAPADLAAVQGAQYPASIAAWLDRDCGTYAPAAHDALVGNVAIAQQRVLTAAEKAELAAAHRAVAQVVACRTQKLANWRDAVRP